MSKMSHASIHLKVQVKLETKPQTSSWTCDFEYAKTMPLNASLTHLARKGTVKGLQKPQKLRSFLRDEKLLVGTAAPASATLKAWLLEASVQLDGCTVRQEHGPVALVRLSIDAVQ